jgi:hypothetical protein
MFISDSKNAGEQRVRLVFYGSKNAGEQRVRLVFDGSKNAGEQRVRLVFDGSKNAGEHRVRLVFDGSRQSRAGPPTMKPMPPQFVPNPFAYFMCSVWKLRKAWGTSNSFRIRSVFYPDHTMCPPSFSQGFHGSRHFRLPPPQKANPRLMGRF